MALVTEQGYKVSEAVRSLDVGDNLIRRWKREFEEEASGARLGADEREELKRLRKENRLLRMEKEILKKASQYFAREAVCNSQETSVKFPIHRLIFLPINSMKTILLCMALVCSFVVEQAAADKRKYTIGQQGGFPPFDIAPLVGVNNDILTAICEANTKMTCNLEALTSTDCVDTDDAGNQITGSALEEGMVDGCMGWFNTPTRKQLGIEFGEAYSNGTTPQLIALDGNTTFDTLGPEGEVNDVTIGFIEGFFTDRACLNTRYGGNFGAEFFLSEQVGRDEMLTALRDWVIVLIFWDNLDTLPEGTHSVGEPIETCGPALSLATYPPSKRRKWKSDNLRRDYNCGLALIRENGKLEEICNRWIDDGFNPACILEGPSPTVQCEEDNLENNSQKEEHEK